MLVDHQKKVERWAARRQQRRILPAAFGEFLAGLADWDWFLTLTFREPASALASVTAIAEWFGCIEQQASHLVGWVMAEEFGLFGGRFHCHGLVAGVRELERGFWWAEAFRRFGRSRIEPCDSRRAAAFYSAKYAAKQLGNIHFGGWLLMKSMILDPGSAGNRYELTSPGPLRCKSGSSPIVPSASVQRTFYRLGLGRWHR